MAREVVSRDEVALEACAGIKATHCTVAVLTMSQQDGSWGEQLPKTAPKLWLRHNSMTDFEIKKKQGLN